MDSHDNLPFYAILGFVLVIVLVIHAPPFVPALFGGFVFAGWLLVQLGVFDDEGEDESQAQDPLEALQTRYATGEISEAEFERRLDRIMESTDAVKRGQRPSSETTVGAAEKGTVEPETEREPERVGS